MLILADGLRPDAVSPGLMPSLDALGGAFSRAYHARTVRPSATVAALASLATGVGPETHRLVEPGLGFLPGLGALRPVARELAKFGLPTDIVAASLGAGAFPVAWALAMAAGARDLVTAGRRARDVAAAALERLRRVRDGLLFVYLPDCDQAGHAHGWMSDAYLAAAAEIDVAVGMLSPVTDDSTLIVTADHGGGGVVPTEHDEPHPVNDHIPLVVAGPRVARNYPINRPVSLLDVPATILWWFGLEVPACFEGQPLADAFERAQRPAPLAV
ncbi:MAG TPA: alkaline phosphatase [Gemmatimonadales bacterium]|nr:alkaline phosphatase [Gemmatimonadales bacterium]